MMKTRSLQFGLALMVFGSSWTGAFAGKNRRLAGSPMKARPAIKSTEQAPRFLPFGETHPAFVGSAEYAAVDGTRVAPVFSVSDRNSRLKAKFSSGTGDAVAFSSQTVDLMTSEQTIGLVGLHKFQDSKMRAGIKYSRNQEESKFTIRSDGQNLGGEFTSQTSDIGPIMAVPVGYGVVVGAEYLTGSFSGKFGNLPEQSTAYSFFSPSAIFQTKDGDQFGLRYEPTISIRESDMSFSRTGGVFLEGRVKEAMGSPRTWFGGVSYRHHRNVDSELKNNFEFNGGVDFAMDGASSVNAYGLYKMAASGDAESFNPDSAAHAGAGIGGSWLVGKQGQLGADLRFQFSDSKVDELTATDENIVGSVSGSFLF